MYKVDKNLSEGSSKKKGNNKLEACATCGQILRNSDLREHLAKHSGNTNQPLSTKSHSNPWSKVN